MRQTERRLSMLERQTQPVTPEGDLTELLRFIDYFLATASGNEHSDCRMELVGAELRDLSAKAQDNDWSSDELLDHISREAMNALADVAETLVDNANQ